VSYADDQIRLIDERIALARRQDRATGTVVSRDTIGPGATVIFDGSTVAMPVRVAGGVGATDGDRVLLTRHGSDWIVTESFSAFSLGEANKALDNLGAATGALTSATFVDLAEFGGLPFAKTYDLTFVRMQVQAQAFVTGAAAKVFFALRFTPVAGGIGFTPSDVPMGGININQLNTHVSYTTPRRNTGIPAGTYTVTLRWRRVSGTGQIFADTNDSFAVELDEHVRALVPIL
jgi:hypothetical protein